ncbi:alkyl/aryl-sulfatase, partial [Gordonia rhizosphera]
QITDSAGTVVQDLSCYDFLQSDAGAPESTHPSLWRIAQLNAVHGLFKVCDGVYQVRNLDISNLSVIVGETGYIVVDPLFSRETAAAAMNLVYEHLGKRPITGIIYTHSHLDHFGGVLGVIEESDARERQVPIIAPADFMDHAVSENIYTGVAEAKRNQFMFGTLLPRGVHGQITSSLGIGVSTGVSTLLAPTISVGSAGATVKVDGIEFEFISASGAEAPSEFHFRVPRYGASCLAENLSRVMHNIYTLRGAPVRDALLWSKIIDQCLDQTNDVEVVFMGHHWPVWGRANIEEFLQKQRDMYRFMHDETLRLINHGYTGIEIAELLEMPEELASYWPNRGLYGSLSHNVKAIYQRYLGWFDGNPANLHPLPPKQAGARYVDAMGGADRVVELARDACSAGDYRWASELLKHVLAHDESHCAARALQADSFEQMGYQAESGPWRNFYLSGAQELRNETTNDSRSSADRGRELVRAMDVPQLIDFIGIRFDGTGNSDLDGLFEVVVDGNSYFVGVGNGCISSRRFLRRGERPDAVMAVSREAFAPLCQGEIALPDAVADGIVVITGDAHRIERFWHSLDVFDGRFSLTTIRE